ncbi:MAG: hypothetical protein MRZ79_27000 [Bacteroidia bacterium]|nr:hypothetical protein [Bacteroidia bacterium]
MKNFLILILGYFLSFPLYGQFTYEHLTVDYASAITYKNLKLVPIRGKNSFFQAGNNQGVQAVQNYLPLRDAMAAGQVTIRDRAGVNQLVMDNLSKQPVILMSGEILKGGKQDRVIAQDMVLLPNSRRNRVPVYCVEEKRWSSPKQWTYYHEGSMHLRRIIDQSQNQSNVWKEISYELKKDNVKSKTRAYTSHSKNPQYAALESKYLQAFGLDDFSTPQNIVGIIGISGSVVIGCDLLASAELFQREFDGLIFSYIDEALTYGLPVDITDGAIQQYADKLLRNERMQKAFIQQYGKIFTQDGKIIHITTFDDRVSLPELEVFDFRQRW